jgi:hypothetical protein
VLLTGPRSGHVDLRIELHEAPPAPDDSWAEVVEVSFTPASERVQVTAHPLALPKADYRVRYSTGDGQHHLLQFWPGPPGPDRIVHRTSHRHRLPGADVTGLLVLDRDLALALSELDDDELRTVARWSALRALTIARLLDHPRVVPAAAALRSGDRLPAPYDVECGWYTVGDQVQVLTRVPFLPGYRSARDDDEPVQQWNALAALNAVSAADPFQAATGAVESAAITHGPSYCAPFLADLRSSFPALRPPGESRR